jgi:CrcB protein
VASIRAAGLRLELPYWREVALGGALGTAARLGVDTVVGAPFGSWDAGVFVANVTGALLLGFLAGLPLDTPGHARWRAFAGTGFLGAYTTFSALSLAFVDGSPVSYAVGGLVASLALGVAGAWVGLALGRRSRAQ